MNRTTLKQLVIILSVLICFSSCDNLFQSPEGPDSKHYDPEKEYNPWDKPNSQM